MAMFAVAASTTMRGMEDAQAESISKRGGSILDAQGPLDDMKRHRGGEHKSAGAAAAALSATPLRDVLSVVARIVSIYEVRMALSLLIGLDDAYGGLKLPGMNHEDFRELVEEIGVAEARGGKLTHAVKSVIQDVRKHHHADTLGVDNMVGSALRMTVGSKHQDERMGHDRPRRQRTGSLTSLASTTISIKHTKSMGRGHHDRKSVDSTVSSKRLRKSCTMASTSSKISSTFEPKKAKRKLHRSASSKSTLGRKSRLAEEDDEEGESTLDQSFMLRHRGALKTDSHLLSKQDTSKRMSKLSRSSTVPGITSGGITSGEDVRSPFQLHRDRQDEEMMTSLSQQSSWLQQGKDSDEREAQTQVNGFGKDAEVAARAALPGGDQDRAHVGEASSASASLTLTPLRPSDAEDSHDASPPLSANNAPMAPADSWAELEAGDQSDEIDVIMDKLIKKRESKKALMADHRAPAVAVDNLLLSPISGGQNLVTEHSSPPLAVDHSSLAIASGTESMNSAGSTVDEARRLSNGLQKRASGHSACNRNSLGVHASSGSFVSTHRTSASKSSSSYVPISERLRGSMDDGGFWSASRNSTGRPANRCSSSSVRSASKSKASADSDRNSLRNLHDPPPLANSRHHNGLHRWSTESKLDDEQVTAGSRRSLDSEDIHRGSVGSVQSSEVEEDGSDDEEEEYSDDDSDEESDELDSDEESDLDSIFSEDDNLDDDVLEQQLPEGVALRKDYANKATGKGGVRRSDIVRANMAAPSHWFIIHPMSKLRMLWDVLNMIFILTEIVLLPVSLGFDVEFPMSLDLTTTAFFAVDMLMSCVTGYFTNGHLVMRLKAIVLHYLRTRFIIDMCATCPWDYLFKTDSSIGLLPRFLRIACRWARLLRVVDLIARLEEMIHSYYAVLVISLFKTMSSFALLCHWCACVWAFIGAPERWWTTKYFSEEPHTLSDCTQGGSCELAMEGSPWRRRYAVEDMPFNVQYLMALQFAFGVMTGQDVNLQAGYWLERIYMTLMFALSFLVCTWMVSNIILMLQKISQRKADFREQMLMVKDFMVKRGVPLKLQGKIRSYLEYKFKAKEETDRAGDFICLLSPWLRLELKDHLYKRLIVLHPFFKQLPDMMLKRVCGSTTTATYAPGDVVFQKGHAATCMCFIVNGRVRVLKGVQVQQSDGQTITRSAILQSPSWIGDMCLFANMNRARTVLSITHCELLCVTKDSIGQLALEFPKMLNYYKSFKMKVTNGDQNLGTHCQYCHQPGHFVGDCPQLKSRLHGNQEKDPARLSEWSQAQTVDEEPHGSFLARHMRRLKESAVGRVVWNVLRSGEDASAQKRNAVAETAQQRALSKAEGEQDRRTGFLMRKKTQANVGDKKQGEESQASAPSADDACTPVLSGATTPSASNKSGWAATHSSANKRTSIMPSADEADMPLKRQVTFTDEITPSEELKRAEKKLKDLLDSQMLTGIQEEARTRDSTLALDAMQAPSPQPPSQMLPGSLTEPCVAGPNEMDSLGSNGVPTPQQPPPLLPLSGSPSHEASH